MWLATLAVHTYFNVINNFMTCYLKIIVVVLDFAFIIDYRQLHALTLGIYCAMLTCS